MIDAPPPNLARAIHQTLVGTEIVHEAGGWLAKDLMLRANSYTARFRCSHIAWASLQARKRTQVLVIGLGSWKWNEMGKVFCEREVYTVSVLAPCLDRDYLWVFVGTV